MLKKKLNVIKTKTLKATLKDLLNYQHYTTGCIEKDGKICSYGFLEGIDCAEPQYDFIDLLVIDGKPCFFATDGKIYKEKQYEYLPYTLEKFNKKPKVIETVINGEKNVLLVDNGFALVKGKNLGSIVLPFGEDIVFYKERFFVSDGRSVKICGILENIAFTKKEQLAYINLENRFGKIYKLVPFNNKLIIFCKNKILSLIVGLTWEEFSIEEVCDLTFSIEKNTICQLNNLIYFSNGSEMFTFNGKEIKKIFTINGETTFVKPAFTKESAYACEIIKNGKKGLFLYDFNLNKYTYIYFNYDISYKDYFYSKSNNSLVKLSFDENSYSSISLERSIEFIDIDFGEEKVKGVYSLALQPNFLARVSFYDKTNSCSFRYYPEDLPRKFSFLSKKFSLKIDFDGFAENQLLELKYRI